MTPEQAAQQLISQSRSSAADRRATSPAPAGPRWPGDNTGSQAVLDEIRQVRANAITDGGNVGGDMKLEIPPDGAASRIGGQTLLEQFRAGGVPVKTFGE